MTKVTDLFPRLRRPLRLVAHPVDDSHAYTACAIRDDVPVSRLVAALASHGLAISNEPHLGFVIHPAPGLDQAG